MAEPHSRPVTVVVLARDAEATIRRTVRAIGEQQICRPGSPFDVTVLVVVNGTSDRTADTALQTWRALPDAGHAGARLHVHEVDAPGKANAWNLAVHECTAQTPDAFVFCDSDIHFERPDTFGMLLDALDGTPHAIVATPVPQKSISRVRSPVVRALATRGIGSGYPEHAIPGGCYAIRGTFARSMELPRTITVDDGFLHAMVLTEQFTATPDPAKVVRVPGASFVYEAKPTVRSLIDHERRLTIGGAYNAYVFRSLHETCAPGVPAGPLLAERNRNDPGWVDELIVADKRRGRRWFVPTTYLTRRLRRDAGRPVLAGLAVALAGAATDLLVSVWANDYFRAFESAPVW